MDRLAQPGAIHGAARWYASELHLPVFPVAGKIPYPRTNGFKDATIDLDQIDRWWRQWPDADVAAPTGVHYDVVDIDGHKGFTSLDAMLVSTGYVTYDGDLVNDLAAFDHLFPVVLGIVSTPRGAHILVPPTGRGNGTNIQPGIDIRGDGGYTVLPPSRRDGVVGYRWATPPMFAAVTS